MRETVDRDPQTINTKGGVSITGETYVRQYCSILNNDPTPKRSGPPETFPNKDRSRHPPSDLS